jgi:hypothetical protein
VKTPVDVSQAGALQRIIAQSAIDAAARASRADYANEFREFADKVDNHRTATQDDSIINYGLGPLRAVSIYGLVDSIYDCIWGSDCVYSSTGGGGDLPRPGPGRTSRTLQWSSKTLRDSDKALDYGATNVTVASKAEAEELFLGRYQAWGYRNTTGMSPAEAKGFFGDKMGTYHWDVGAGAYPHGMNHLQVHTYAGDVIRIFFP